MAYTLGLLGLPVKYDVQAVSGVVLGSGKCVDMLGFGKNA